MNIHENDDWYDGQNYYIELLKLTDDEIDLLNNIINEAQLILHRQIYSLLGTIVIFSSDDISCDLDLHIRFVHFLKEIEERLERESEQYEIDKELVQIEKQRYYEEK